MQLRSSRSAQRIGGGSFKRPLPEGFRIPAKREIRVYDTCRVGNGHIRLFAKEVLTRFRRIKPVTMS